MKIQQIYKENSFFFKDLLPCLIFLLNVFILSSFLYSTPISFEFKLRASYEKNENLIIEVEGKNRIKDDILASLYKIKVRFFIPYFEYYSDEYDFRDILKPDEQYNTTYILKMPYIQMPGFYTIFGIFTMEDVNTYPISNVTYTVLKYGDTSKLFLSSPNIEISCSDIKGSDKEEEDVCFEMVKKFKLKVNISIPPPISEYVREGGLYLITQPELKVTPATGQAGMYKFFDSHKRTLPFIFTSKNALDDSKYIFYIYSYINYTGVDDIYHIENIIFKYLKKVPRKIFENSFRGFLLPSSIIFVFLFLLSNLILSRKLIPAINTIENISDYLLIFVVFFAIYSYLFSLIPLSKNYFHPDTPYIAGDNATHYNLAKIVKEWNIGKLIINGWDNSHFNGYKIFQTYFPLPFILIAVLSFFINFNIAFKIIHISGTFLLPLALFISGRWFGLSICTSTLLSVLSLFFLVLSSTNNIFVLWGGNLASTLAGEFCFSFSFTFFVLYCGLLYKALNSENKKRYFIPLIILEVFTSLSHAFTMFYILFFLIFLFKHKRMAKENFLFIVIQQVIVFMLIGWWLIPTLAYKSYTFSDWYEGWSKEIFLHPNVLCLGGIVIVLAIFSITFWWRLLNYLKTQKVLFILATGLLIFGVLENYIAHPLGVADIRFFPLSLFALMLLTGLFFEFFTAFWRFAFSLCISILLFSMWFVSPEEKVIKVWARFNGKGLKFLNYHDYFQEISETLKGTFSNGRVLTDKSGIYDPFGSPLALTLLPHYSKRQVLDGMDYRSSASSFFAFDLQTTISSSWGSYPDGYRFSAFNLKIAKKKAKVLNVENIIVADPKNIPKFLQDKDFYLIKQVGPFHIFNLKNVKPRYVEPLSAPPILVATENWKAFSYKWFKNPKLIEYPVIFIRNRKDYKMVRKYFTGKIYIPDYERVAMRKKLGLTDSEIAVFPEIPQDKVNMYDISDLFIDENITHDKIEINVSKISIPLLVKINYHPQLKVKGADYLYFATPSFFIVVPREKSIRIYLGYNLIDIISIILFYIALIIVALLVWGIGKRCFSFYIFAPIGNKYLVGVIWLLDILLAGLFLLWPLSRILTGVEHIKNGAKSANALFSEAESLMYSSKKEDHFKAREKLSRIFEKYKSSGFLDEVLYKLADINFRLENLSATNNTIEQIFKMFPESIYYGYALILWAKLFEKMGAEDNIATAKILYQIAKQDYPDTEIEELAVNELQKYEKKQLSFSPPIRRVNVLQRLINKLSDREKENLQYLLRSKEFQKLLQIEDKKLLDSIINRLTKGEGND